MFFGLSLCAALAKIIAHALHHLSTLFLTRVQGVFLLLLGSSLSVDDVLGLSCSIPPHTSTASYLPSAIRSKMSCFDPSPADALKRFDFLTSQLVCQDAAITQARGLLSWKLQYPDKRTFVHFAGPKGVGKTSLAKIISRALSYDDDPSFSGAGSVTLRASRCALRFVLSYAELDLHLRQRIRRRDRGERESST